MPEGNGQGTADRQARHRSNEPTSEPGSVPLSELHPMPIGLTTGIFDPKHVEALGVALWAFAWAVRRQTTVDGRVLGGRRLTMQAIATEIGCKRSCAHEWLKRCAEKGYIELDSNQRLGTTVRIKNPKKWQLAMPDSGSPDSGNPDSDSPDKESGNPDTASGNPDGESGTSDTYRKRESGVRSEFESEREGDARARETTPSPTPSVPSLELQAQRPDQTSGSPNTEDAGLTPTSAPAAPQDTNHVAHEAPREGLSGPDAGLAEHAAGASANPDAAGRGLAPVAATGSEPRVSADAAAMSISGPRTTGVMHASNGRDYEGQPVTSSATGESHACEGPGSRDSAGQRPAAERSAGLDEAEYRKWQAWFIETTRNAAEALQVETAVEDFFPDWLRSTDEQAKLRRIAPYTKQPDIVRWMGDVAEEIADRAENGRTYRGDWALELLVQQVTAKRIKRGHKRGKAPPPPRVTSEAERQAVWEDAEKRRQQHGGYGRGTT